MKKLLCSIVCFFLASCSVEPTTVLSPTGTPILVATKQVATNTLIPTQTPTNTPEAPTATLWPSPTVTNTPQPPKSNKYIRNMNPTPIGVQCEIEPQWNQQPTPDHMKQYGCFAFSCGGNGWVDGNNYYCVFDTKHEYSTPWPYDWVPYHPLMDNLNNPN